MSELYIGKVYEPILKLLDSLDTGNLTALISDVLDGAIKAHKTNAKMHEALHSLTYSDEAVNAKFMALENDITEQFFQKLLLIGYPADGLQEKVHLAMNVVQSFAHEYVFDKHEYIDYEKMRADVTRILVELFR